MSLVASRVAPAALAWLERARTPRLLHLAGGACYLADGSGDVAAVVESQVGAGPFHIVLPPGARVRPGRVRTTGTRLVLGPLELETAGAPTWSPLPRWDRLRGSAAATAARLVALAVEVAPLRATVPDTSVRSPARRLIRALRRVAAGGSMPCAARETRMAGLALAGLGPGLTPAGDDVLIGAIYGLRASRHPLCGMAPELAETAAARTGSVSAAWLRAAGRGEAPERWHRLVDALAANDGDDAVAVALVPRSILQAGRTSGAHVLYGFLGVTCHPRARSAAPDPGRGRPAAAGSTPRCTTVTLARPPRSRKRSTTVI